MRRAIACALMMTLLLLPGCGEREEALKEGFGTLREAVTQAGSISFHAELTASRADTVESYSLSAAYDGSETTVEVLAPALIAGITATALRGETAVSFQGVELGAGPLDEEGLTPMSAIPVMLDAIASAYVELLWWEGDYLAARLFVGEDAVLTLWLDRQSLLPAAAEVATGGRTVIAMQITDFQIG